MIIGKIKDGIVLDHITAGRGMEIYKILGLDKLDCTIAMIKNADSIKMGKKDIIKVGQIIDLNVDVLGYIDPGITVNIIQDGKCKNPRCITSTEQELVQEFRLTDREKKIYRCIYCEHEAPKPEE